MTRSARGAIVLRSWALAAALILGAGFLWPLVAIGARSLEPLAGRRGFDLATISDVLGEARTWRLLRFTLLQAGWSTVATLALGLPLAWVLSRRYVPGRVVMLAVVAVPFVLPSLVVAGAVLELSGIVGQRGAHPLVLIVASHVVFNLGLVARIVSPAIAAASGQLEDAARTLGCTPRRAAVAVVFRSAVPAVASAAALVFLLALTSFGVVLTLGSGSASTLEVEVWYRTTRMLDLPGAAVLAAIQLIIATTVLVAVGRRLRSAYPLLGTDLGWRVHNGRPRRPRTSREAERWSGPSRDGGSRGLVSRCLTVAGAWCVAVCVSVVPIMSMVARSLRRGGAWTLENYRDLGRPVVQGLDTTPLGSLARSLAFAAVAGLVAVVVAGGLTVARTERSGSASSRSSRVGDRLATLPLGTSAATLGFGLVAGYSGMIDLRGTWLIVVLAQAMIALPVVVRTLAPGLDRLQRSHAEAAAMCGAGPVRRLRELTWPMMRAATATAAGFAVAVALGEFGATTFVATDDRATATVMLSRLLARPGDASAGRALALSSALGALCAAVFVYFDRIGRHRTSAPARHT